MSEEILKIIFTSLWFVVWIIVTIFYKRREIKFLEKQNERLHRMHEDLFECIENLMVEKLEDRSKEAPSEYK